MEQLITNTILYNDPTQQPKQILIADGRIQRIDEHIDVPSSTQIIEANGCTIMPGMVDLHVHLREPGFERKETIASGTMAAASAGYTALCAMPNLNPTPDTKEHLQQQLDLINKNSYVRVYPYGCITMGQKGSELADINALYPYVCAFSDDGHGVQQDNIMETAMTQVKALGGIIAAHCEVNELLEGGYIHKGEYAALHHHKGICSESEWKQIERDIELVRKTQCRYHVCHISTKESVELIRKAKQEGLPITCETGPHYLLLNDMDLKEEGRYKMNPPLRSKSDQEALLNGIIDGTIDVIATDHAPHTHEEKSRGLEHSAFGITGLETAFPLLYTYLVERGIITLEQLVNLMSINPRRIFQLDTEAGLQQGDIANVALFNLHNTYHIEAQNLISMGKATPFDGYEVHAKCVANMIGGKLVYHS